MSNVEKKILDINMFSLGEYQIECFRINAPLSIQALMKSLPLKGRALKQGDRLIMATSLKIRPEKPTERFEKGDISIDPSSGNISIHLVKGSTTPTKENLLGTITTELETKNMPISTGILIKETEN